MSPQEQAEQARQQAEAAAEQTRRAMEELQRHGQAAAAVSQIGGRG